MNPVFKLPNNRPLEKAEAERIRDAAIYFASVLEENLPKENLRTVFNLLHATVQFAYDQIPLMKDRGTGY